MDLSPDSSINVMDLVPLLPDDTAAVNDDNIAAAISAGNTALANGLFDTSSAIVPASDKEIVGAGSGFYGTVIKPASDIEALTFSNKTRMFLGHFQLDATNITTEWVGDFYQVYLSTLFNVWVRNAHKGFRYVDCDTVNHLFCRFMENSEADCIEVSDNAGHVNFFSCNFEKNNDETDPGGTVRLTGEGGSRFTEVNFVSCGWERGKLIVESGTANVFGGKIGATIDLLTKSRDCDIRGKLGYQEVHDFGLNNRIHKANCQNLATPIHEWPKIYEASPYTDTYGDTSNEWLFLVSAIGSTPGAAVSSGTIDWQDDSVSMDISPTFNLATIGSIYGERVHAFSWATCVKAATTAPTLVLTNCGLGGIRGGQNLITNGTFSTGDATGWTETDCTATFPGGVTTITPANSTWGFYQQIHTVCTQGKKYLGVAKFSGSAQLVFGSPWDGGSRRLLDGGVADLYGDGDTVAMVAFEYLGQHSRFGIGSVSSSSVVTIDWIALIEVAD